MPAPSCWPGARRAWRAWPQPCSSNPACNLEEYDLAELGSGPRIGEFGMPAGEQVFAGDRQLEVAARPPPGPEVDGRITGHHRKRQGRDTPRDRIELRAVWKIERRAQHPGVRGISPLLSIQVRHVSAARLERQPLPERAQ